MRTRLQLSLTLAGAVALGTVGPVVLRRGSIFRVRRVEVVGARFLAAEDVATALRLRSDASVFDPLGALDDRVLALPGVIEARVARRLPGTLVVTVREREPIALTPVRGRLSLIDRRGRVLPFDPTRGPADVPIAAADSAVLGVIARVRDVEGELFRDLVSAHRRRNAVVLETPTHRLLLRIGATAREIRDLRVVMGEVARRRMPVAEFDARFEGRIIVRGRGEREGGT